MVEQKPVNVGWQTLFMFVPFVDIWAFYRIEKLRMGLAIIIGTSLADVGLRMILPFPYGLGASIGMTIFSIAIQIYFIRKWSMEWNNKISQVS